MELRERLKALITSKHVVGGTMIASFAESIIVPIPLETVLVPAMQANRDRIWLLAGAALAGCLMGAALGYAVGYWLIAAIGEQVVELVGTPQQYQNALEQIRQNGFLFVLSVGLIPIPFQIAMLAAGAAHYSLLGYIVATLISRGIRYYGLAVLVWKFGNGAQHLIERHKRSSTAIAVAALIAIWSLSWAMGK